MQVAIDGPEYPFDYSDVFREFRVCITGDSDSVLNFEFCPFCGVELPSSKRSEYFDILEDLEIDAYPPDPALPEDMQSGAWWRKSETP